MSEALIRESGLLYQAADEAADNSFAPELRWLGGQLEFVEAMRGLFLFQPEIHAYRWEIHRAVGMLLRINRPACLRYAAQSLDVDAIDDVERAISVEAGRRWRELSCSKTSFESRGRGNKSRSSSERFDGKGLTHPSTHG